MSDFPKFTNSAQTGELGVAIVAHLFTEDFRWIFRRVHQEQDFGIDGYVDIVNDENFVTGRSFAVQIKCGKSYFKECKYGAFWYQGENKHLNYLLNHPVPVVLILVNPNTKDLFWRAFDINDTEECGNGWRMPIPCSQRMTKSSKQSLLNIVGKERDFSEEINWYWKLNNLLVDQLNPLVRVISRNEVNTKNFSDVIRFFDRVLANSVVARKCQGNIEFSFFGYDSDPRALYEIPEVRAYIQKLEPIVKYWFFYLSTNPNSSSLTVLMLCVCRIQVVGDSVIVNLNDKADFLTRNFVWLNEITDKLNFSLDENKRISDSITNYFCAE